MKKIILILTVAFSVAVQAKDRYVVKDNTNAAWPYTTWGTAAADIQTAVDAADSGDTVLIDNGVYDSGATVTPGYTTENRVVITKNITVRGMSKAGVIISGQELFSRIRCVYMTAGQLEQVTIKNGKTLSSGDNRFDQSGGGAYLANNSLLTDCVITNCSATQKGGGVYGGQVVNCSIMKNSAAYGGGSSGGTLINCNFFENSATTNGGGSYQGTLTACSFSNNSASYGGGCANGTLINCTFSGNSVTSWGGASYYGTLTECTITNNSAYIGGGSYQGILTDCKITSNSATNGGGVSSATLTNCVLSLNSASNGGGSRNSDLVKCSLIKNRADSSGGGSYGGTLTKCNIAENTASFGGGSRGSTLIDCLLAENEATLCGGASHEDTLTRCTLIKNRVNEYGGGCYNSTLDRCLVTGNIADIKGGGIYGVSIGSSATNSIIIENSAIWGGGTYGDVILHNCTIKGNSAINDGGGCHNGSLYSCIVVENKADGNGNDLFSPSTVISSCSPDLTQGLNGSITNAPKFADIQLHLRADSPCIDSGIQQGPIGPDFDGLFRPLDGNAIGNATLDMGAHEFACALVDTDGDGLSDADEVNTYGTAPSNSDTDSDGRTDGDEVAMGFSPTYNEAPAITQGEENVTGDPAAYDLYTSDSIQDLNMGLLMLQTSNETMYLSIQMKTTSDLEAGNWTNAGSAIEWDYPTDTGKAFFRVRSE